jgi:putative transposase
MRYRRAKIGGGTYFFTVNLADRRQSTLVQHIDQLRSAIRQVMNRHPFSIEAIVIMPEHLHTIWTLPENDQDYPTRWALVKAGFSRALEKGEPISKSRCVKGERGIWQRRYWEHLIRDDEDFSRHLEYIHFNPVRHGIVANPIDWPYSSLHRFVSAGTVPADWGARFIEFAGDFGE